MFLTTYFSNSQGILTRIITGRLLTGGNVRRYGLTIGYSF